MIYLHLLNLFKKSLTMNFMHCLLHSNSDPLETGFQLLNEEEELVDLIEYETSMNNA